MSDGGMHVTFNGLSSIRDFSVVEVMQHLVSLRETETAHLERSMKEFNSANKTGALLDSQRMFIGLIENRAERYQAAVDALETLAQDVDTVTLDVSRELSSQILSIAASCVMAPSEDEKHPVAIIPDAVKKTLDI